MSGGTVAADEAPSVAQHAAIARSLAAGRGVVVYIFHLIYRLLAVRLVFGVDAHRKTAI